MANKIGHYRKNMRMWHECLHYAKTSPHYTTKQDNENYINYRRNFDVIRDLVFSVLISFEE